MKKIENNEIIGQGFYINFVTNIDKKFDILDFFDLDSEKYPFLLESVAKGNERARYSILFRKPNIILEKIGNHSKNFLEDLDKEIERKKIFQEDVNINGKKIEIPFLGGWFIYLGYELVMEIEKSLRLPNSPYQIPTAFAARVSAAIIYDKIDRILFFITEGSKEIAIDMAKDFEKINKKVIKTFSKKKIK